MTSTAAKRRDVAALFLHAHACPAGTAETPTPCVHGGLIDVDYEAAGRLLAALDRVTGDEPATAEEVTR